MASSPCSSVSGDIFGTDNKHGREQSTDIQEMIVKEGLRQSIIARRRARGEKQLKIAYTEPKKHELTPVEIEKRERRREQNRRAAQRCRHKKRVNQKTVVQNYERVIARNEELQDKLDRANIKIKELTETLACHSACCPSLATIKSETEEVIKVEAWTDDEFLDTTEESFVLPMDLPVVNQGNVSHASTRLPASCLVSQDQLQNISKAHLFSSDSFIPTYHEHQQNTALKPMDIHHVVEQHQSIPNIRQQHTWQYSPSNLPVMDRLSTSCMFNESSILQQQRDPISVHHSLSQNDFNMRPSLTELPKYAHNNVITSNSAQRRSDVAITPMGPQVIAHNQVQSDGFQLLRSQNSPSQVVPSLRSPRPSCATPRTSWSQNMTRQRSLSGGSTSETLGSFVEERAFSSVSSEGSMHTDKHVSLVQDVETIEELDTDTEDVFLNAPTKEEIAQIWDDDLCHNTRSTENDIRSDNSRGIESEVMQFLVDSGVLSSTNSADTLLNTDLMVISNDDLQHLVDSSYYTNDLILNLLSDRNDSTAD